MRIEARSVQLQSDSGIPPCTLADEFQHEMPIASGDSTVDRPATEHLSAPSGTQILAAYGIRVYLRPFAVSSQHYDVFNNFKQDTIS